MHSDDCAESDRSRDADRRVTIDGLQQIETVLNYAPVEYFWLFMQNESIPQNKLMRSLELMTTKVWPNFTDVIGKARPLVNGIIDAAAQPN